MVALKREDILTAEVEDVLLRKAVCPAHTAVSANRPAREGRLSARIDAVRVHRVSPYRVGHTREDA